MPENVDQTPEQETAPGAAGEATPDKGGTPKNAGEDLRAIVADLREKLTRMEQLTANQRSLHDRQLQKMQRELQDRRGRSRYGEDEYDTAPTRQPASGLDPVVEDIRRQQEILGFKSDNPDWNKHWEDVMKLLADENQASMVSAYKKIGDETVLDYYKSYHNALREVKLRKMEKAEAAADTARQEAEKKKADQKRQATISGVGASGVDLESLDINNMTSEEMMDKGLVPIDPRDPPRRGLVP